MHGKRGGRTGFAKLDVEGEKRCLHPCSWWKRPVCDFHNLTGNHQKTGWEGHKGKGGEEVRIREESNGVPRVSNLTAPAFQARGEVLCGPARQPQNVGSSSVGKGEGENREEEEKTLDDRTSTDGKTEPRERGCRQDLE